MRVLGVNEDGLNFSFSSATLTDNWTLFGGPTFPFFKD